MYFIIILQYTKILLIHNHNTHFHRVRINYHRSLVAFLYTIVISNRLDVRCLQESIPLGLKPISLMLLVNFFTNYFQTTYHIWKFDSCCQESIPNAINVSIALFKEIRPQNLIFNFTISFHRLRFCKLFHTSNLKALCYILFFGGRGN